MAIRLCVLCGGYHCETIQIAPGKKPASNTPSKNRVASSPPKFFTTPVKVITMPQDTTRVPMYQLALLNFARRRLLGTSNKT
jgi:hypothetical protein